MSSSPRLDATLDLLDALANAARPADAIVSAWFRGRRDIDGPTRAAVSDTFYAVLRHQARLDWWLARHGRTATPRTRLLAWLAIGEGWTLDRARAAFTGGEGAPTALTDNERGLLVKLQGVRMDHPAMPDEVRLECPAWAVEPLRQRFGGTFAAELGACLAPPPLDLRVNPLKATREAILQALHDLGVQAEACRWAPHGIRVAERLDLGRLPMLKTGAVEIQDEGSQFVALLVDAQPGEHVVDFCAGAGGKTLALASQMANKGHLVACDVSEGRLKRAAARARQAGLQNIETRLLANETDRWIKRHKGLYDRVLVDAPCSGTGTWRRNPDARWRDSGLDTLVPLQQRILASAARLVKPGGRLVYATCSLLPEENEAQVAGFLAAHPGWRVVPVGEAGVDPELADAAYLSLTPARHGTDGFFAAVIQRDVSKPSEDVASGQ